MTIRVASASVLDFPSNTPSEILGWDGRLDNRSDLLWQLQSLVTRDSDDSQLALAAFNRWGVQGLARLVGDWSLVLRYGSDGTVLLASDFMGVRPLYYHTRPGGQVFWSADLRALVATTRIDNIDEVYVCGFLMVGGCPNRTPYAGIHSVPPGHAVIVTKNGATCRQFWTLPTGSSIRYEDERLYDDHFRVLFREAVAVRLPSETPALAELSGGLDSSSIVCMASRLIHSRAVSSSHLQTISYVHRDSTDLPFIREVESACRIQGVHLSMHDNPLAVDRATGGATPAGWMLLYESVSAIARRMGASVLLTGQGGDLATGNWFDDSLQVANPVRHGQVRQAVTEGLAWSKTTRRPLASIIARGVRSALSPSFSRKLIGAELPTPTSASLTPSFSNRVGLRNAIDFFSSEWMQAAPERRKHFHALTVMRELRLLQRYEAIGDLECTHPFAHRPLIEFLMSVPAEQLCRPGNPRRLMRRSFADLWPDAVRRRRSKSLFTAPWSQALRPLARDLLKSQKKQVVERGWVERSDLDARLARLSQGLDCNEPQLRQIVLLEYWLRRRTHSDQFETGAQLEPAAC